MNKSLLILSAPLVMFLLHADEPAVENEGRAIVVPAAPSLPMDYRHPQNKPRRLVKIVPQTTQERVVAQNEAEDESTGEEYETSYPSSDTTSTTASTPAAPKSTEARIKSLECQMQQLQAQLCDCCQPFLSHPDHSFYLWGEFLYWKFTEGGTEFAISPVPEVPGIPPELPSGHAQKVELEWEPGFRVGVGYHFCEKGWDIGLYYTQVKPDGDKHLSGFIHPLLLFVDNRAPLLASTAKADWNLMFQTLDFELGRKFRITKTLDFRPYFGGKAARIDQHLRFFYENDTINPDVAQFPMGEPAIVHVKNEFEGIGLKAGLSTVWEISKCYGFSLYGDAALSLLVSEIEVKRNEDDWEFVAGTPIFQPNNIVLKSTFHPLLPVVEAAFGVEWGKGFCCDKYRVSLHAGIEGQYWWRQNYLEYFSPSTANPLNYVRTVDDLGIYGLDFGIRFDF